VSKARFAALTLACLGCTPSHALQGEPVLPLDQPARISPYAVRSVVLSVTPTDAGPLLAAGEHGHILTSTDAGRTWAQSPSPVSVTLTAVTAGGSGPAFAVGHGLTILRSTDGGKSWAKQTDGRALAARFQAWAGAAQQSGNGKLAVKLGRLAKEGADKPLLDIVKLSDRAAIAVGAYGVALRTSDGGMTWDSAFDGFPGDDDRHLNAIRRVDRAIWVAGERGLMYRSLDDGRTFQAANWKDKASLFAIDGAARTVVAVGLRGTIALSTDAGTTWARIDTGTRYSITSLAPDPHKEGIYWAGDDSGGIWSIDTVKRVAKPAAMRGRGPIAALFVNGERAVMVFGALGIESLGTLPQTVE